MKILIDGDVELYRACNATEEIFTWEHDLHTLVGDSKAAIQQMQSNIGKHQKVIETWLGTPCTVVICFSGSDNWRKIVYPPYKAFRVIQRRPIAFKFVKKWFLENTDSKINDNLEADDLLGILSTSSPDDGVIVSIDKDLRSVPGFLYNPDKDQKPHLVSLAEADWFHVYQTLMGDKVDGYPGLPSYGPVRAAAALGKPGQYTTEELWARAISLYKRSGKDIEPMALVSRILRKGEWDDQEKKVLWKIPYPAVT